MYSRILPSGCSKFVHAHFLCLLPSTLLVIDDVCRSVDTEHILSCDILHRAHPCHYTMRTEMHLYIYKHYCMMKPEFNVLATKEGPPQFQFHEHACHRHLCST